MATYAASGVTRRPSGTHSLKLVTTASGNRRASREHTCPAAHDVGLHFRAALVAQLNELGTREVAAIPPEDEQRAVRAADERRVALQQLRTTFTCGSAAPRL
jgi:hypothetical protein